MFNRIMLVVIAALLLANLLNRFEPATVQAQGYRVVEIAPEQRNTNKVSGTVVGFSCIERSGPGAAAYCYALVH